jgi:cytochrome o ubiquinol oxidase subunit 1
VLGLALVFYIWWLAILSAGIIVIGFIVRSFRLSNTHVIPAHEIAAEHRAWLAQVNAAVPVTRDLETRSANLGRAQLETPTIAGAAE